MYIHHSKQHVKQLEKERKLQQRLLKRQIAWLSESGHKPENMDGLFGPISSLPKALMDKNGLPYKSAKCATTPYLEKRYKSVPVIVTVLPWVPTSVIMEGMFMVQTEPFPTMENMKEYVKTLLLKHVRPHYVCGVIEVHVFDNSGALSETPKELEQKRRDMKAADASINHECCEFSDTAGIPE